MFRFYRTIFLAQYILFFNILQKLLQCFFLFSLTYLEAVDMQYLLAHTLLQKCHLLDIPLLVAVHTCESTVYSLLPDKKMYALLVPLLPFILPRYDL